MSLGISVSSREVKKQFPISFTAERAQTALTQEAVSDTEAPEIGIGFEKDSILLYLEMRGLVPRANREIVVKVINEEKSHLCQLTDIWNKRG